MKRLLDYNEFTGMKTWFIPGEGDEWHLQYEQDAEAIIESNKEKQGYGREYYVSRDEAGEYHKVASIPIGIQYKWLTELGVDIMNKDHWPKVKKLLNDPDWRWLKTAEVII